MTHEAAASCAEGVKWNLYRNGANIRARWSLGSVALFLGSKVLFTNYSSRIRTWCPVVGPWQLHRETFRSGHCGGGLSSKATAKVCVTFVLVRICSRKDGSLNALIHLLFLKKTGLSVGCPAFCLCCMLLPVFVPALVSSLLHLHTPAGGRT